MKILFHILDGVRKRAWPTLEQFKIFVNLYGVEEFMFEEFDTHICGLIGNPLMEAGLAAGSAAVCLKAIGMGASVTVEDLEKLRSIGADMTAFVETRFGRSSLAHVFAYRGNHHQLEWVLGWGMEVDGKTVGGSTPLHRTAQVGAL